MAGKHRELAGLEAPSSGRAESPSAAGARATWAGGDSWALGLVVAVVVAAYVPMLATGNLVAANDDFLQYAARHEFLRRSVFDHCAFPLRSHCFGSGYPTLGDPEDPTLNPLVWCLLPLPTPLLLKARIFVAALMAAFGTFLLARRALAYTTWGAAFAALVFPLAFWLPNRAYSGNPNEVYPAFVPLCLLLILTAPRRPLRFVLLPLLMFTMLSDGKQTFLAALMFMGVVCAAWAALGGPRNAARSAKERLHPLIYLCFGVLFALVIGLVKILPTLEVLSHHGGLLKLRPHFHIGRVEPVFPAFAHLAEAVLGLRHLKHGTQWAYVGVVPVTLFLGGTILARRKTAVWGVTAFLLVWLLIGPNAPVNLHAALNRLPFCSTFDQTSWKYFLPFFILAVSLGAGAFFGPLLSLRPPWLGRTLAGVATAVAVIGLAPQAARVSARAFTMAAPVGVGRVPNEFYSVAGCRGMKRPRAAPARAVAYFNLLRDVGTIDWYTSVPLPESGQPRYIVAADGELTKNEDYEEEAHLQKEPNSCAAAFEPNEIRIDVDVTEPDVLTINQNFHPGWRTDRGVLEARDGLLALKLHEPGSYRVTLRYTSRAFNLGLVLSLGGIVLLAAFVVLRHRGRLVFLSPAPRSAATLPEPPSAKADTGRSRVEGWMMAGLVGTAMLLSVTRFGLVRWRPFFHEVHFANGHRFCEKGRYERALQELAAAIELDPRDARVYVLRGVVWGRKGQHHQAMQDFTKAIALDPDLAEAYVNRARAHYQMRAYDKAWADVKMCRNLGYKVDPGLLEAIHAALEREK